MTDWISEGVDWIVMQTADEVEVVAATKLLYSTGEYKFDLTKQCAHLRLTGSGSRYCLTQDENIIRLKEKLVVVDGP